MKRSVSLVALCAVCLLPTACAGSGDSVSDTTIVDVSLMPAGKVIDVRTADEFVEGHVQGARNLDLLNGDFEAALQQLDKDVPYSIYCRSGNRSATAAEMMRNAGFANVVDLGALDEAAQTLALPIVR